MLKCEVPRTFFFVSSDAHYFNIALKIIFSLWYNVQKERSHMLLKQYSYAISVTNLYIHMWFEVYENLIIIVKLVFFSFISFRKLTFGFWYLYLLFVYPHAISYKLIICIFFRKSNCGKLNYDLMDLWKSKDFAAN